jgi:hypothetical protein
MSRHEEATDLLRDVQAKLAAAPQGELDLEWVQTHLPAALKLLAHEAPRWISTAEAQQLLGIAWESAVAYWADIGWLRSRPNPSGGIEVRLDDVLDRRLVRESLLAIGGDDMTADELRILKGGHSHTRPDNHGGPP